MKFFLSLLMLTSISAYSFDESFDLGQEPIGANQIPNIMRAILEDLNTIAYDCKGSFEYRTVMNHFSSYVVPGSNLTFTFTENNTAPFFTAETKLNPDTIMTFIIKLAPDLKRVTAINYEYKTYSISEKNTGTILRPAYEKIRSLSGEFKTTCTEVQITKR